MGVNSEMPRDFLGGARGDPGWWLSCCWRLRAVREDLQGQLGAQRWPRLLQAYLLCV